MQSKVQEIGIIQDRIRINSERVAIEKWIRAKE
jgi:hypothetical protein